MSNEEKIKQLKQQVDDIANNEKGDDEIADLEEKNEILKSKLEEIKNEQHLELLTEKIILLKDEMIANNITGKNTSGFVQRFVEHIMLPIIATPIAAAPFAVIRGGVGAVTGSIFPGLGTGVGAIAGAQVGGILAGGVTFGVTTATSALLFAHNSCMTQ